ncbi:MAG TPA: MraY family glycosyltransferase [Terriglobales bacterium]|nr:MraY family glycosyltransferase [Terriglobales bacterium]
MLLIAVALFFGALFFSLLFTRKVRNLAVDRHWAAGPVEQHHLHTAPIPRFGGIAVYGTFISVTLLLELAANFFGFSLGFSPRTVLWVVIPATLVFLVGVADDIWSVTPRCKFAVQIVAALILFFGDFRVMKLPLFFGSHVFAWMGALPLTIVWVLWVTNAFNLIDGLDGLAAGSALFSTLAVFTLSLINQNALVSVLTIILAGATLGFLKYNFNPATIFLGDSGSLFIGFTLSALALVGHGKTSTMVAVSVPVISFGLPILDTVISVIRRFLSGRPLFSADRQHIHHKLMERGLSHRQVVILLYGVSAACGLLSLFILVPGQRLVAVVLLILAAGVWFGVQYLHYPEFLELARVARRTVEQKEVIRNNLAIRRAKEQLVRARSFVDVCEVLETAFEGNDFDAFRLGIHPSADWFGGISHRGSDSCAYHTWQKDPRGNALAGKWNLTLELRTSSNRAQGFFSMYRISDDRPLMIDLNLLGFNFSTALANALERAFSIHDGLTVPEPYNEIGIGAAVGAD